MNKSLLTTSLICLVLLFTSCSITSRKYMPGYQVEWKSSSVTSKERSVVDRQIKQMHSSEVREVSPNELGPAFKTPFEKIVAGSVLKNKIVEKHLAQIAHTVNVLILPPHQSAISGDGRHDIKPSDTEGGRLAGQSLDIATVAVFILAIGIVIAILGVSQTLILEGAAITALAVGLILGMILGFVSFFEGIKAMRLTADDPDSSSKHRAALTAVILGGIAAAVIAIPILIIVVFSLLQI